MRRMVLMVVGMLWSAPLFAAGINLSWDDCGTAGVMNKNFTCDSDTGRSVLFGSFVSPLPIDSLTGFTAVIDLCSMELTLPSWWVLSAGGCRAGALQASFEADAQPTACASVGSSPTLAFFQYTLGQHAWNDARILLFAYFEPGSTSIDGATEYFAFALSIDHRATTEPQECTGCTKPTCIVLNEINLTQSTGEGDVRLTSPHSSYQATWQGGFLGCPFVVPIRASSWGTIKSLYR